MKTTYNACRKNLESAEMLPHIHAFNISDSELELEFGLGQKDKEQWKVTTGFHSN